MTTLADRFVTLTTPHLADGCIRAGVEVRCAPAALRAIVPGKFLGPARPVQHVGSVDLILEAVERSSPGEVLVVDNEGRVDEACVGDLMLHEANGAELAGVLVWGLHRDTVDIAAIGLPLVSLGAFPTGPLRLDSRPSDALDLAHVGPWTVTEADLVVADEDGVLFIPLDRADEVFTLAERIRDTEARQADLIRGGTSLREQVGFAAYLAARESNPELTFRDHLRSVKGEIEV